MKFFAAQKIILCVLNGQTCSSGGRSVRAFASSHPGKLSPHRFGESCESLRNFLLLVFLAPGRDKKKNGETFRKPRPPPQVKKLAKKIY